MRDMSAVVKIQTYKDSPVAEIFPLTTARSSAQGDLF